MGYVETANVLEGRDRTTPSPVLNEFGVNYRWRMFFENNRKIVDADSLADVIGRLIPGYELLDEEQAFVARKEYAEDVQSLARAFILSNVDTTISPEELNILSMSGDPHGWGEEIDVWSSKYPLVLLETNYQPYTDIATPLSHEGDFVFVSNIIWLRPVDELEFLKSLSRIGHITFGEPA